MTESFQDNYPELFQSLKGSFVDHLGLEILEACPEKVVAELNVQPHHLQPHGYLHGGVSLAVSESLASIGAFLNVDIKKQTVLGQEINANHLKSLGEGEVLYAVAEPLHRGRSSQVWETKIRDKVRSGLVAISRCTLAVKEKR